MSNVPDFEAVPRDSVELTKPGKWDETLKKVLDCPADKILRFNMNGYKPQSFEIGLRHAARAKGIKLSFKFSDDMTTVLVWRR
jgi:hypothetical protein